MPQVIKETCFFLSVAHPSFLKVAHSASGLSPVNGSDIYVRTIWQPSRPSGGQISCRKSAKNRVTSVGESRGFASPLASPHPELAFADQRNIFNLLPHGRNKGEAELPVLCTSGHPSTALSELWLPSLSITAHPVTSRR